MATSHLQQDFRPQHGSRKWIRAGQKLGEQEFKNGKTGVNRSGNKADSGLNQALLLQPLTYVLFSAVRFNKH